MKRLEKGDLFEFYEGTAGPHEVMDVTICSATVRACRGKHKVIRDDEGEVKAEWDSPGRRFTISTYSMVRLLPKAA